MIPIFKGATRPAMYLGIPMKPLLLSMLPIASISLLITPVLSLSYIPIYFLMRGLVKNDEKFFTEMSAKFELMKSRGKLIPHKFNGLRVYTPLVYTNKKPKLGIHKDALNESAIKNYIPYIYHVTDSIIKTDNNEYIATLELQGKAFFTVDFEDEQQWWNDLNSQIKTIASNIPNISFFSHIIREKSNIDDYYYNDNYKTDFSKEFNKKYLERFSANTYRNRLFFTISIKEQNNDKQETIQILLDVISQLSVSLSGYNINLLKTYQSNNILYSKQLEFYSYLLNKEWSKVPVLNIPFKSYIAINKILFSDEHFQVKALNKNIVGAVIDIKDYSNDTKLEQLNQFLSVDFETNISQSFSCIHKRDALKLLKIQQKHLINSNDYSETQIAQLNEALDDVQSGNLVLGEHHCNIFVYADNQKQVDKNLSIAKDILSNFEIDTKIVNPAVECAYFASLPANQKYILRPSPITSKNFACFSNFHNHFNGKPKNNPWGNAITVFETDSKTPIFFNFHEESNDVKFGDKALGNTLIAGQSGGGKTVLLNLLLSNLEKTNTTSVFFDKDKGAKIAILAMGGQYFDLELGKSTNWNPLQLENTPENIIFLNELIQTMLNHSGRKLTIQQVNEIKMAIETIMTLDKKYRTLKELSFNLPKMLPEDTGSRLDEWINQGQYSWLFDSEEDTLDFNNANITGFDCTQFLDYPVVRTPLMMYLLHRMEQVIDGRNFAFFMDEFWKLLQDDVFIAFSKDKLKTIRKQNGIGIFATQEPADALQSDIGKTIVQQTATQILLPNPKADEDDYIKGLKLTQTEFEIIKELNITNRQFLIKKSNYSTLAKLNLYGFRELKVLSGDIKNTSLVEHYIKQGLSTKEWLDKLYEAN